MQYKADIGGPKVTKANIVSKKKGQQVIKGVYVRVKEDDGVYPVRSTFRNKVVRTKARHSGEEVMFEGEVDEAMGEAIDDQCDEAEASGVLTLEESKRRAAAAVVASGGVEEAAEKSSSSGEDSEGEGSSSVNRSDKSNKDSSDSDSDAQGGPTPKKHKSSRHLWRHLLLAASDVVLLRRHRRRRRRHDADSSRKTSGRGCRIIWKRSRAKRPISPRC